MFENEDLIALTTMEMPFGRYEGRRLIDLPEPYLAWFARQGFPRGRLGRLLSLTFEIKSNGLTGLVRAAVREHRRAPEPASATARTGPPRRDDR